MHKLALAGLSVLMLIGAAEQPTPAVSPDAHVPSQGILHLKIEGLRSEKGSIRICLWRDDAGFPDCKHNPHVATYVLTAKDPALEIDALPAGKYGISAIHDENDNKKLDKSFIGLPTEGVAFSNNAKINFGPPKFAKVQFSVDGDTRQTLKMRYFL